MLDNEIISQLKTIFSNLKSDITLRMLAKEPSEGLEEMRSFLEEVASTSSKLSVETVRADVPASSFEIIKDSKPTGVGFCGIPNGHEFTTLLLAILNADGQGKNLPDDSLRKRIQNLGEVKLQTYVSLTCTNCPEVAQALNIIALLNPNVENTVIDGAVVPELVDKLNIQSVPTVYANGELLSVGRSSLGDLLEKLEKLYGGDAATSPGEPVIHEYDVVIVGGGPAGVTAAIYAARKGFKTAVVAKSIGGQVKETMGIENLTSVPETTGPKLAEHLREHLAKYPVDIFENRSVNSADFSSERKLLMCGNETFSSPAVIIATGAGWRRLGVPGEEEHLGRGVAFCTHCDGPFYAGKRVAVIGGGNSGIEAAIDLANLCPDVDVFEFMDSLKADGVLQEKAKSMGNINIHLSSQVMEVIGDPGKVSGLKVKDRMTGEEAVYPVEGVFVQIGLTPNSSAFKDLLPMTRAGEIIVDAHCRTSVKGVYAAGDVSNVPYKQIVIAMGEGAKAALSAFEDTMRGELS